MKKTAITLIELIISITTASILFILLGNIISKKLNAVSLVYEKGTYYCWKDWSGTLYQKTPMGNIQPVSSCKIKIPKDAKNIQAFIIGGGSSGFVFNKNTTDSYLSNQTNTPQSQEVSCIEDKTYSGLTALISDLGIYKDLTTISDEQKNKLANTEIVAKPWNESLFEPAFIESLIKGGYCTVPVYKNKIRSNYKLPAEAKYYSKGSDETANNCAEAQSINDLGVCYKDGFIKDSNLSSLNLERVNVDNKLKLKTINETISFNGALFKRSTPGEVIMGTAEAGKEYTIASGNIGNGGVKGGNGGETKFENLVAKGGVLENENISITTKITPIKSVKGQEPTLTNICSPSEIKCSGTLNNKLDGKNLEVKTDKVISIDFNPKVETDESTKKGFGLFGASGAAQDCQIQYYSIKKLIYNSFSEEIESPIAELSSCKDNLTDGMGGAVIIRWE